MFQEYALSLELQISKEEQLEQQRLWDQAKVFNLNIHRLFAQCFMLVELISNQSHKLCKVIT